MRKTILAGLLAAPLFAQFINGSRTIQGGWNYCADAGSNDTYACSLSPAPLALTTGAVFSFKANTVNTGAATINFNGLGAKPIKKHKDTDLADGDIKAGQFVYLVYDGTNMQMLGQLGNAPSASAPVVVDTAGQGYWSPLTEGHGGTYIIPNSVDHDLRLWQVVLPVKVVLAKVSVSLQAASGTGCSGGTCGLVVGLYDKTCGTLLGYGRGTSGGSPNINTTGVVTMSLVGGALTLEPGVYYLAVSTDSGSLSLYAHDFGTQWYSAITAQAARFGKGANNSTGNGGSLAFPSTCGTITIASMAVPITAWER